MKILESKSSLKTKPLTWVEINLEALRHNFNEINRVAFDKSVNGDMKKVETISVVKADAYGHGMVQVSRVIEELGGQYFGVSNIEEAITLREAGIKGQIILFESTLPENAGDIVKYQLTPTICTLDLAQKLNDIAVEANTLINVHLKIDTGMGRLGIWHVDALQFIEKLRFFNGLTLKGIYTHFPSADDDPEFTEQQIQDFYQVLHKLEQKLIIIPEVHAANSMALAGYANKYFSLARPGLMLYGLYPKHELRQEVDLRPVMSVRSKIIFLKHIEKGRTISYGRTFTAAEDLTVATLPIGYNDGYPRALSNKGKVLIQGVVCPVLGRVTMDQVVVDVSQVSDVNVGDEVVILGDEQGEAVTADELARHAHTINYEIVCSLGNRLPRVFYNN